MSDGRKKNLCILICVDWKVYMLGGDLQDFKSQRKTRTVKAVIHEFQVNVCYTHNPSKHVLKYCGHVLEKGPAPVCRWTQNGLYPFVVLVLECSLKAMAPISVVDTEAPSHFYSAT